MASSVSPELPSGSGRAETEAELQQAQVGGESPLAGAGCGEGPDRATAGKDLGAALVIALFAGLVVVFSIRLDVPGSITTAPGLFPVIIGSTLFAMAAVLGSRAIRAGATLSAFGGLPRGWTNAVREIGSTGESARTALLIAMVTAYVLLVGLINFEFSLPLGIFTARISSYEVISVIMVTWILRHFWQAHPARCLIVALVSVEVLASIFRYGFAIPMPSGY